jgi:hypothetical protein
LVGLRSVKVGRYVIALIGGSLIVFALFLPKVTPARFWNHLLLAFARALFATVSSSSLRTRRADV